MLRPLCAGLTIGALTFGTAMAAETPNAIPEQPVYLQIIVKACPVTETPLEPVNQGKVYDEEKPKTLGERKAALTELGCVDVPIPMEYLADSMSPAACRGHAGYLAAQGFLEQRQDLAGFPAVGAWQCIETDYEVVGAAAM